MAKAITQFNGFIGIISDVSTEKDKYFPIPGLRLDVDEVEKSITFNSQIGAEKVLLSESDYANMSAFLSAVTFLIGQGQQVGGLISEPVEVTVARPSDTTPYSANDAISSSTSAPAAIIFDLANCSVPAGGSGYLVKARLVTNKNDITPRIRVHLYKSAPTQINDNSPFTLLWANRANRIGYIDFPALATAGTGSDATHSLVADLRLPFKLAAGETRLWAIIQTLDAFTPSSGQQLFFSLLADRN